MNWEFHLSRGSKAEQSSVLLIDAAWLVEEGKWKETLSTFLSLSLHSGLSSRRACDFPRAPTAHSILWGGSGRHKTRGISRVEEASLPFPETRCYSHAPFFSASCHFKESLGKASHTNCFNLLSPLRPRTEATSILAKQDRTPCRASLCTC